MPPRPHIVPIHAPGESKLGTWKVELSAKVSETGKRRREYFATKAAAEQFCKESRARLAEFSDDARLMTGEQRLEAYRCQLIAGEHGFTLAAATEAMRVKIVQARRSLPVRALVDEFITYKQTRGLSADYLKDMGILLDRFAAAHADILASELTAAGISAWIDTLKLPSPVSWNNNRRMISVLLNYAARHQPPYVSENVLDRLEERPVDDKEVDVWTVAEARAMLDAAAGQRPIFIPVLAIGLFAGIRPDETRRLDWSEIHWPEGEHAGAVEVKGSKSKTARRRLVEMQPVLAAWLLLHRQDAGPIWPGTRGLYYETFVAVRKAAGVERMVDDGFRHTFASSHHAKFNDLGRLTNDLGHTSSAMLFEHYRRVVKRADAEAFFNLFPNNQLVASAADGDEGRVQQPGQKGQTQL